MKRIHKEVKQTYGSPRMTVELNRRGLDCSVNTVAKYMRLYGLRAKMDRRYKPRAWSELSYLRKANLLEDYRGPLKPNQVWVSDVTYLRANNKRQYLSTVMDVYNREIIGSYVSSVRNADLVVNALQRALTSTDGKLPVIFHSDRGSEYANHEVHDYLKQLGIKQSMSGKGHCYDNAFAESFFHTYKSEFYHHETFKSVRELKRKTKRYIQYYNERRLHSGLGYQSPMEYDGKRP